MAIIKSNNQNIIKAANILKNGKLVSFPTETVYGLGAIANNDLAVANIFLAKKRPTFNPLIAHFYSSEDVFSHVKKNKIAEILAENFWPGPLTMILYRKDKTNISLLASAGNNSLGVRVPSKQIALKLIKLCECPIVAPSANLSGKISPTEAKHVEKYLSKECEFILDGGNSNYGLESTVIDCRNDIPIILRHGPITKEMINDKLKLKEDNDFILKTNSKNKKTSKGKLLSPGLLESHYAPNTPLRINAKERLKNEVFIDFGNSLKINRPDYVLSKTEDLTEAAANLFSILHKADEQKQNSIAIAPIPMKGLGVAINDRLIRASTNKK